MITLGLLFFGSTLALNRLDRLGIENSIHLSRKSNLLTIQNQEYDPSIVYFHSNLDEPIQRAAIGDPSSFRWFQEYFYPNANCEGEPFRVLDFMFGECFTDSTSTSFMYSLNDDGNIVFIVEYADDHCGKISSNETMPFLGNVYEGPESIASCIYNPHNRDANDFPTSAKAFAYKSEYQPSYLAPGHVSKLFTTRGCTTKMLLSNWHSLTDCVSAVAAEIPDNSDKSKRFRYTCDNGFPDVHGFSDDQCQIPSKRYPPMVGVYRPECEPSWASFTKFTPSRRGEDTNAYTITLCVEIQSSEPVSTKAPVMLHSSTAPASSQTPSKWPTAAAKPIALVHPLTTQPTVGQHVGPVTSSGPDESSTSGGSGGGNANTRDSTSNLFQLHSLSTELIIVIIASSAVFCLCATTVVCFLCLRLQSQDSLNRDLMQSFVQLVERNGRALRSTQEKFSSRVRRNKYALKEHETELRDRETRGLLSQSEESKASKSHKSRRNQSFPPGKQPETIDGVDVDEYIDDDDDIDDNDDIDMDDNDNIL